MNVIGAPEDFVRLPLHVDMQCIVCMELLCPCASSTVCMHKVCGVCATSISQCPVCQVPTTWVHDETVTSMISAMHDRGPWECLHCGAVVEQDPDEHMDCPMQPMLMKLLRKLNGASGIATSELRCLLREVPDESDLGSLKQLIRERKQSLVGQVCVEGGTRFPIKNFAVTEGLERLQQYPLGTRGVLCNANERCPFRSRCTKLHFAFDFPDLDDSELLKVGCWELPVQLFSRCSLDKALVCYSGTQCNTITLCSNLHYASDVNTLTVNTPMGRSKLRESLFMRNSGLASYLRRQATGRAATTAVLCTAQKDCVDPLWCRKLHLKAGVLPSNVGHGSEEVADEEESDDDDLHLPEESDDDD